MLDSLRMILQRLRAILRSLLPPRWCVYIEPPTNLSWRENARIFYGTARCPEARATWRICFPFAVLIRPMRRTRKVVNVVFIPGFAAARIDRYDEAVGMMIKHCYFDISKPSRSRLARAIGNRMASGWSLHQKPDVWAVAIPDMQENSDE